MHQHKPVIGITCGDINGIGMELIIKTFSDHRILEQCTPVIFGSNKLVNFYKKSMPEAHLNYQNIKDFTKVNPKQLNILNCWEEDINVTPGQVNELGGKYAVLSLMAAAEALREGHIQGVVTAPIHKKNVQSPEFNFTGHTPFFKHIANAKDVLMLLYSPELRVALVTEHLPVSEVAQHITKEIILSKINLLHNSLRRDFGIDKPKIAVLGLNPHAGDEGLIGNEEERIIRPAIKDAKSDKLVFGPYSADAFFARQAYREFDAVLAMYHDQGLPVLKHMGFGRIVNLTLGLPILRTSVDHGTALDLAGGGRADSSNLRCAIEAAIELSGKPGIQG